jgi:hypothetical protein
MSGRLHEYNNMFNQATGLLLVILACALDKNWLPLVALSAYLLAPLPNLIATHCCGGNDLLSSDSGYAIFKKLLFWSQTMYHGDIT